jgi:DNA-binding IclR family transcriptional regulator
MHKDLSDQPKYTAPALEKGIDIIEFLARSEKPQNLTEIASGLKRSKSEIFRMITVHEQRGLIERSGNSDTFRITNKLFSLRLQRSDTRQLISVAIPQMEAFSQATSQSCHIAIRVDYEIVVIAKVEAANNVSVSIPIGHRRSLVNSPSGKCILALTPPDDVDRVIQNSGKVPPGKPRLLLKDELAGIAQVGYCIVENGFATSVVGVSAPIVNPITRIAEASITTTLLQPRLKSPQDPSQIATLVRDAANSIAASYYSAD